MPAPESPAVREAIAAVLTDVARHRSTITYEGLLARLEPDVAAAAGADLAPILRAISRREDEAGRGLLTAVVVRSEGGIPSAGFFGLAAERGRRITDRTSTWREEVERVYAVHTRTE